MAKTQRKIVPFPVSGIKHKQDQPTNRQPVLAINHRVEFNPKLGGNQSLFDLSIQPLDLQRLLRTANEIGLQGKKVFGFAYDPNSANVYLTVKSND